MDDAYTPIPNFILDNMHKIGSSAFRIICTVARQTAGWAGSNGGRKRWDTISLSQFCTLANMARATAAEGVQEALDGGWIRREKSGRSFKYRLATSSEIEPIDRPIGSEIELVQKLNSSETEPIDGPIGSEIEPLSVQKLNTQKKERKDHQRKGLIDSKPTAMLAPACIDADDRDGRMTVQKIQDVGFMYLDSSPTRAAMQIEQDYTDSQIDVALQRTLEAHRKQIKTGKRGITAPLAYMAQVLRGMQNETQPIGEGQIIDISLQDRYAEEQKRQRAEKLRRRQEAMQSE